MCSTRQPRIPPPIWLMRQAGRYLPEYRACARRLDGFLDLCFTPKLAAEVTLQPVRRSASTRRFCFPTFWLFRMRSDSRSASPWVKDHGLMRLRTAQAWSRSGRSSITRRWNRSTRRSRWSRRCCLPNVALLGFCGAPWTVATYMIAGHGTPDQAPARLFAYRRPGGFSGLIDKLVEASASYLVRQLQAGVDAVQIFDTWAGVLPAEEFERWCIEPTQRDRREGAPAGSGCKNHRVSPRVGTALLRYVEDVPVDAVGLDWTVDSLSRATDPVARAGAGQSRPAGAGRRRRGA